MLHRLFPVLGGALAVVVHDPERRDAIRVAPLRSQRIIPERLFKILRDQLPAVIQRRYVPIRVVRAQLHRALKMRKGVHGVAQPVDVYPAEVVSAVRRTVLLRAGVQLHGSLQPRVVAAIGIVFPEIHHRVHDAPFDRVLPRLDGLFLVARDARARHVTEPEQVQTRVVAVLGGESDVPEALFLLLFVVRTQVQHAQRGQRVRAPVFVCGQKIPLRLVVVALVGIILA